MPRIRFAPHESRNRRKTRMRRPIVVFAWIACASALALAALAAPESKPGAATASAEPRVFLLDGKHLAAMREKLRSGDKSLQPALEKLRDDAVAAIKPGPWSVTAKRR